MSDASMPKSVVGKGQNHLDWQVERTGCGEQGKGQELEFQKEKIVYRTWRKTEESQYAHYQQHQHDQESVRNGHVCFLD